MKQQTHKTKSITLKHLLINKKKCIGIQFYTDKVIQALVKQLPSPKWSNEFSMVYLPNNKQNLDAIFKQFKGVAWVNTSSFFSNKPVNTIGEKINVDWFRKREVKPGYRSCPEEYLLKLELKKYANNTVKTYVTCFEAFINYYKHCELLEINEDLIRKYLQKLIQDGKSNSYINQAVNSIKFYYEVVLGMPNRFYSIERPRTKEKLPTVLSESEVKAIIQSTRNLKHKAIISTLYSTGARISELLNMELIHIDGQRNKVLIPDSKGGKDRYTIISAKVIELLRLYVKQFKPKKYLFEGANGSMYSDTSVRKIILQSCKRAGIKKKVSPHTFRHCFATHLLENSVDLRYIQVLLGHGSSKTTERYTYVSNKSTENIVNPIDNLF